MKKAHRKADPGQPCEPVDLPPIGAVGQLGEPQPHHRPDRTGDAERLTENQAKGDPEFDRVKEVGEVDAGEPHPGIGKGEDRQYPERDPHGCKSCSKAKSGEPPLALRTGTAKATMTPARVA